MVMQDRVKFYHLCCGLCLPILATPLKSAIWTTFPDRVIWELLGASQKASNDMSDMLNLNCWVLGDDPQRIFSVKIAKSETGRWLKEGDHGRS